MGWGDEEKREIKFVFKLIFTSHFDCVWFLIDFTFLFLFIAVNKEYGLAV